MKNNEPVIDVLTRGGNGRDYWRESTMCGATEAVITWKDHNGDEYLSTEAVAGILSALLVRLPKEEALEILQRETSKNLRLIGDE